MISLEKLPENTRALFAAISSAAKDGILDDMLLLGGTALAMRLGHRMSEDIDFAIGTLRLPTDKISVLMRRLNDAGCEVVDVLSESARDDFENDGLDIENYQQDWLVNGAKLTFFTFGNNEYEQKTISDSSYDVFDGIKIASLDTIAKTKCHALTKRTKSRDLFDVYHLIQVGALNVESVIAEMQKFNSSMTYETCVHRIVDKQIQADDEGLNSVGVSISIGDIRKRLSENLTVMETSIAREIDCINASSNIWKMR